MPDVLMPLLVTPALGALLALFYIGLAKHVIDLRKLHGVSTGSGKHPDLELAMRAHGNFAEYVPLSLILLGCAEINHARLWLLLPPAALVLAGRLLHAWCFLRRQDQRHRPIRVAAMSSTFAALALLSLLNLGQLLWQR